MFMLRASLSAVALGSVLLAAACATSHTPASSNSLPRESPAAPAPEGKRFLLGADLSDVFELPQRFVDLDGRGRDALELLADHGFNAVRLRTFVEPTARYGYAWGESGCRGDTEPFGSTEPFGDAAHVVALGKRVKDAGMAFLLNFHYSDTWADPGKQMIPEAWRDAQTIDELAQRLRDYTADVLRTAVASGARPDIVQLGNEINPGMLMHVPGPNTNCWGHHGELAPVNGSTENWDHLAVLLRAGVEAVREVDPTIEIMLHLVITEHAEGLRWWVDNARARGVHIDILGVSCYTNLHGNPAQWERTLRALASNYHDLDLMVAEYDQERTQTNLMIRNLPQGRGRGTFLWGSARDGQWSNSMFIYDHGLQRASPVAFAEVHALLPLLGLPPAPAAQLRTGAEKKAATD